MSIPPNHFCYMAIMSAELIFYVLNSKNNSDLFEMAKYYRESIFINMQHLRGVVDELETLISKEHWTLPTYSELLFSVE